MDANALRLELDELREDGFLKFNSKLIPTSYEMLGVRTPDLKKLTKKYLPILDELSPQNYEEIMLKGLSMSYVKDIDQVIAKTFEFLPYIDNWAVCDCVMAAMKIFGKHTEKALNSFEKLICSDSVFERRFVVIFILDYCLTDKLIERGLNLLTNVKGGDYYVDMAVAWAISVALVKYWDKAINLLTERKFNIFTHNKAIQKARESYRISETDKEYLSTLKIAK